jgi:hypothetical protein
MKEVHVLINSDGVPIGAFSDKSVIEEYVACNCEAECEYCQSLAAPGKKWSGDELFVDTVFLNDPTFVRDSVDSREESETKQVHLLSNGFGEILGAYTDKAPLEKSVAYFSEGKCQYCEAYEARGEECPYRQSFIDTLELDDPSLIAHCKERIAQVHAGVRESNKPAEHGLC